MPKQQNEGVNLSDQTSVDVPHKIYVMIGADYTGKFLLDKKLIDWAAAQNTRLGWVCQDDSVA